jgi:photosystem II PsbU protein
MKERALSLFIDKGEMIMMRRFGVWVLGLLIIFCIGLLSFSTAALAYPGGIAAQSVPAYGKLSCSPGSSIIDLNNSNIDDFCQYKGLYPTIATLVIQHSPYAKVEDVLSIAELSDRQRDLLKSNLDHFTVSEPTVALEARMPPRPTMR